MNNNTESSAPFRHFRRLAGPCLRVWLCLGFAACSAAAEPRLMTLEECIALALENNLDCRMERIDRTMAELDIEAARGAYDPSLSLSASRDHKETEGTSAGTAEGVLQTTQTQTDDNSFSAGIDGATALHGLDYALTARAGDSSGDRADNPFDTTTASVGVTLTQPLLQGFKTDQARYRVATARKQSAEAELQWEDQVQASVASVESAWYALIRAREEIAVQREALRLAEQLQADTDRKVRVGTAFTLDAKQAESQAASARAALSDARRAYQVAQNELKSLVFADQRAVRAFEIQTAEDLAAAPVDVDVVVAGDRALESRPDIRAKRLALERQGLTVDWQRNQTLPSMDLVAGAGLAASDEDSYGDAWSQLGSADEPYWTVGVTFSFPLGNRAARASHRQSLATADRMQLELRQLEESALVEVENAVAAVETGWEKIGATRDARAYAEEALAAEQKKLDSGKSTSFVVLQLQQQLTSARRAEIAALADYRQQLSTLARAQGLLLEQHGLCIDSADSPEK